MSRLYKILKGVVDKVNSIKTGANWNQNDPNGPGYIENRTHSRVPTQGASLLYVNDPVEFIEEYEEGGVTKHRWTQEQFEVTVSGSGITPPEYNWSTNAFYDKQIYAGSVHTEYQLVPAVFTGDPERYTYKDWDDNYEYGIDINCSTFRLYRPEGYGSWMFTPYVDPDMLGWNRGKFYVTISDVSYAYNKLDVNYLPTVDRLSDNTEEKKIPNAGAVYNAINYAIENNVDYFKLQNTPAYNIPESYERAISPKLFDSIDGSLPPGTTSPVDFDRSKIKLWPTVGSVYRVYFEGQYYTCTCYEEPNSYDRIIGNISYQDSELSGGNSEPFCIAMEDESIKLYFDSEKKYNSIHFYVDLVHEGKLKRLDTELLPEGVIYITDTELQDLKTQLDEGVVVDE